MENEHHCQDPGKADAAGPDLLVPSPHGQSMTILGREVAPIDVHFVPYLSEETNEEDIMPFGLNEREKEIFLRGVFALRPRALSSRFGVDHGRRRTLPTVEPLFERRVVEQGTIITIIMRHVMRKDIVVQVQGRDLIVSGLVREPVNSSGEAENNTHDDPERKGNARFLYYYKTGVTKMIDLSSIFAGHREGHVDVVLRHAESVPEDQCDET